MKSKINLASTNRMRWLLIIVIVTLYDTEIIYLTSFSQNLFEFMAVAHHPVHFIIDFWKPWFNKEQLLGKIFHIRLR